METQCGKNWATHHDNSTRALGLESDVVKVYRTKTNVKNLLTIHCQENANVIYLLRYQSVDQCSVNYDTRHIGRLHDMGGGLVLHTAYTDGSIES